MWLCKIETYNEASVKRPSALLLALAVAYDWPFTVQRLCARFTHHVLLSSDYIPALVEIAVKLGQQDCLQSLLCHADGKGRGLLLKMVEIEDYTGLLQSNDLLGDIPGNTPVHDTLMYNHGVLTLHKLAERTRTQQTE